MFRDLKKTKEDNFNLLNERETLLEDFQNTQQALNEEVLLRIKF